MRRLIPRTRPADTTVGPALRTVRACAGLLRRAADLLSRSRGNDAHRPPSPRSAQSPTTEAGATRDHLGRLSKAVDAARRHGERAEALHLGAGRRIDAALYELEQLRQDLQSVVDPKLLVRTSEILEGGAASAGSATVSASALTAAQAKAARSAA